MERSFNIFISSAMRELATERKAVATALRALGFEVWIAEELPATGETPREICVRLANECHLFIGILGAEYGSIIPGESISPTELEFNEAARESPRKVLMYVKECKPRSRKQAKFINRVNDFNKGYFRRPRFRTSEELVSFVCEDVVRWICSLFPDDKFTSHVLDAAEFIQDVTIPDGTLIRASTEFTKIWEIRNSGKVMWKNRYLKRLGASSGPGLIFSPEQVRIADTPPGQKVQISVRMRAPDCAGTTTCQWKMVTADGNICFPDKYPYGLIVTIHVAEN